ncbi:MAG: lysyl oxidase family protein [Alphaproteobacteria bacterium]
MRSSRRVPLFLVLALFGCLLPGRVRPAQAGPELVLDAAALRETLQITYDTFRVPALNKPWRRPIGRGLGGFSSLEEPEATSGYCALAPDEACVGGPGIRRLLRFDVLVHNRGDEDMVLGNPYDHPEMYTFSACHGHYHFTDASIYELRNAADEVLVTGRKQGFCMMDSLPSEPGTDVRKKFDCTYQGISVGMADLYEAALDCQWLDVTDVPPGRYAVRVVWDPLEQLDDGSRDDNEVIAWFTIPPATEAAPVVGSIGAPANGGSVAAGRVFRVAWTASDDVKIATQEIWLSLDDGSTWTQLVGDVPGNRFTWNWNVPTDLASDRARLRIVARDGSAQPGERTTGRFSIGRATPARLQRSLR